MALRRWLPRRTGILLVRDRMMKKQSEKLSSNEMRWSNEMHCSKPTGRVATQSVSEAKIHHSS